MDDGFTLVGIRPRKAPEPRKLRHPRGGPVVSMVILGLLIAACGCCELFLPKDPGYMDLYNANLPPNGEFLFGTDTMGRDIFSMVFYGGRVSLFIGFFATLISTVMAVVVGSLSALGPKWLDSLIMRLTEIFLSIPSLLLIVLIQALLGKASALSIGITLGITGWTGIAKVVRTEVRQLRHSEYVVAARAMGAGFFRILRRHLTPNFLPAILFMVVMNIRSAITMESTLSFMGIGLPLEVISWGSMLSLSDRALLSGNWWIILIPGAFLVTTLLCVTNIGNFLRKAGNRRERSL